MDPTDHAIKGFYCSRSLKYFVPSWKSLCLLLQAWKSLWCVLRSSSTQNGTESHMPYKTLETNCWVSKGHDRISISFHQNWEITALYSITIFHEEDLQIFLTLRMYLRNPSMKFVKLWAKYANVLWLLEYAGAYAGAFSWYFMVSLTHWGQVTHICVSKLTIIGSDNGLSPGRRQAIIWTNAGILLIRPLGTNFSEILIRIQTFSFKKMHLKMSSAKWHPFCLGLNVLRSFQFQFSQLFLMSLKLFSVKQKKINSLASWRWGSYFKCIKRIKIQKTHCTK